MGIRGILFDAAGIFYDRPEPTSTYVSKLLAEGGFSTKLPPQDRKRQQALRSQAKCGQLSPDEYWDQRLQMHGVTDPEERRTLVSKINHYSDQVLPIPGGSEAMARLKRRGFLLGIVTDTIYPVEWKMRWLSQVGVAEFVDVVACSTVVGAHKPDPAIYLDVLQQAHLTPPEAAFVGHNSDELEGAHRAGMLTVAVHHEPGARADYYARSLVDLLNVPAFGTAHAPERHRR